VQEWPDRHKGFDYARTVHPTRLALEKNLAALEGARFGLCFSSGMAATSTVIQALSSGDHVVCGNDLYGGTYRVFTKVFARFGVTFSFVDATDLKAVEAAFTPQTRLVWIESPSNPLLKISDIGALAKLAHSKSARLVVDNTFASPALQRPLALGADVVVHSATKYLGGHSDVLAGVAVTRAEDAAWADLKLARREEGACLGAVEAWLLLRGLRTLFARVERQSATAARLAARLAALPGVTVLYPGLPSHPQHAVAARQMHGGFGGMLSICTGGGAARALAAIGKLRVWVTATSLGGVESLVEHRHTVEGPTSPTPPDLLRLSVGLEHEDDLFEDLAQALR